METKRNKVKIEINEKRGFKGVFIPKKIWTNEELIWTEKILLVEINSLDNDIGCYAGNEHFSKFLGISKDRVSKLISSLKNKMYIDTTLIYKDGSKEVEKRIIRVNRSKFNETDEDRNEYSYEKLGGIVSNNDTPIVSNNQDINTLLINTINNKDNSPISSSDKKNKEYEIEIKFDEWYNLYSNKHGRQKALKSFKTIIKKYDFEELMKNTELYIYPYVNGLEDKKYQKYPATFLNGYHPGDEFEYKKKVNYSNKKQFNGEYQKQDAMSLMLDKFENGGFGNEPTNERRGNGLFIPENVGTL